MAGYPDLREMMRDYRIPFIDKGTSPAPGIFNPVGIVCHHTASGERSGDVPSLSIVRNGRGGANPVPGPLSQLILGRAATVVYITSGRANHPGKCDRETIDRIRRGEPQGDPNVCTGDDDPNVGAAGHLYGIEAENNGLGEPWPAPQIDRYVELVQMFCAEFGWDPRVAVVAHKKITKRKIDPSFDMRWFLDLVTNTKPPTPGDDDMPLSAEDLAKITTAFDSATAASEARIKAMLDGVMGASNLGAGLIRADLGKRLFRVHDKNAQYMVMADAEGLFLIHITKALKPVLIGGGEVDNLPVTVVSDPSAVAEFKALRGYVDK